jgi:predicted RNA-binding protein with PIN domain
MALVRILIDGYSLLHNWPQLAPRMARHSAVARNELIHVLTQYRDAIGTPITVGIRWRRRAGRNAESPIDTGTGEFFTRVTGRRPTM